MSIRKAVVAVALVGIAAFTYRLVRRSAYKKALSTQCKAQ